MAATTLTLRPAAERTNLRSRSKYRVAGLGIGLVGLVIATVVLIGAIVAGNLVDDPGNETAIARFLAWSFGLATVSFGTVKVGIAIVLVGILVRLWLRVDSVKESLLRLKPNRDETFPILEGEVETASGRAVASATAPKELPIHKVARTLWAPSLLMGAMLVGAGFVLSIVQTGNVGTDNLLAAQQGAWVQGLQFLGEGMLLGGISFLLGTILGSLRQGGGEVQESVGVSVQTLKMPVTAKLFLGFMMLGMMVAVAQFVLYVVLATTVTSPTSFAAWSAWLGPLRELGLGLLLLGIVLALVTIGKVLGFQFRRITDIVRHGI